MIGKLLRSIVRKPVSAAATTTGWDTVLEGNLATSGLTGFGMRSNAGTRVSPESVMHLSAVFACTAANSSLIASLPLALYARGAGDSRDRIDDALAELLTLKPNSAQTALEFWEGMVAQMLLRGNAPAERVELRGRLVGLRPLLNAVPRLRNGELVGWQFTDRGRSETLPVEKVFNIPGFSAGGGLGLSVVRYGVHSFGAALAADETSASFFANAMQPGGLIEFDTAHGEGPTSEQLQTLRAQLESYIGSKRAGKTYTLPPGAKFRAVTMNPEDAQLLETRRYSVEDICRWFGTPPVIIGHAAEGQTMWGTGVEAIMLAWLTRGINPLLRRIEARILSDLVPPARRRSWYFEFNREAMLQMDSKAKGQFMSLMGASGTMTANERRARLNLPRSEDPNADRLLAQTALAPLESLGRNDE